MTSADQPSLATASEGQLRRYVEDAYLPALLVTLSHLTGDRSLLADEFRSSAEVVSLGMDPTGGLSPETRARAIEAAIAVLLKYRENVDAADGPLAEDDLMDLMQFTTGPVSTEYVPLLLHELALGEQPGAPTWSKAELAADRPFRVAVIGAGMSGLLAAHRLGQAGLDYVVFERFSDVGGVWFANGYPGARLDTSNLTYSYSFEQRDWEDQYSKREAVMDYYHEIANDYGIRPNIQFDSAVRAAEFDEGAGRWTLTVEHADGRSDQHEFDAVVSAVGQLNEPNFPDFPGRDSFAGLSWHTATWNHDVDLTGKRVAVIGTGASAFQVIPKVAEIASELTVFQRTPAWVLPTPGYTSPLPEGQRWLLRNLPHYKRWLRFNQFWLNMEGIRHLAVVDPEWQHPVSVSAKNEGMRSALEQFLRSTFADRPDLAEKLLPNYPPYAKRTVRDDGIWARALMRPNVTVSTDAIEEITPTGVRTKDGTLHEVDVIVYGTGFTASEFLSSMTVRGRGGVTLEDYWGGDARAYYGISIPEFPNLFCLYGPNTNLNVNGSTVLFSEAGIEHVLECVRSLLVSGRSAMTVRQGEFDAYNQRVDAACLTLAMGVSKVNSWYKNKFGRVSQNWPLSTLDYWEGTRRPVAEVYDYL